jgi:hypothetical protein
MVPPTAGAAPPTREAVQKATPQEAVLQRAN